MDILTYHRIAAVESEHFTRQGRIIEDVPGNGLFVLITALDTIERIDDDMTILLAFRQAQRPNGWMVRSLLSVFSPQKSRRAGVFDEPLGTPFIALYRVICTLPFYVLCGSG